MVLSNSCLGPPLSGDVNCRLCIHYNVDWCLLLSNKQKLKSLDKEVSTAVTCLDENSALYIRDTLHHNHLIFILFMLPVFYVLHSSLFFFFCLRKKKKTFDLKKRIPVQGPFYTGKCEWGFSIETSCCNCKPNFGLVAAAWPYWH